MIRACAVSKRYKLALGHLGTGLSTGFLGPWGLVGALGLTGVPSESFDGFADLKLPAAGVVQPVD